MVQNTLPSHRAFVVPHHSVKTTVLASILLVAQAQGHLPVNGEQLYVGLVLAAIFLRLVTTYLVKVRPNISMVKYFCSGLGPIPRSREPDLWPSLWTYSGGKGKEGKLRFFCKIYLSKDEHIKHFTVFGTKAQIFTALHCTGESSVTCASPPNFLF